MSRSGIAVIVLASTFSGACTSGSDGGGGCPTNPPETGSSCTRPSTDFCGYSRQPNPCGASNCYCQGGAWSCGPTCVFDASVADGDATGGGVSDVGSYGSECIAAGGQCVLGNVICAVPGPSQTCGSGPGGAYCCLSEAADCGQPATTSYVCPATSDGGASCRGSAPVPIGAPNYEALVEAGDPDASYPAGCTASLPACNRGHVPTCTCNAQGSPTWSCVY